MENAADALKMAAFFLIFLAALSISINAFGEARRASQSILDSRDREYDYTYVAPENNRITQRTVRAETIVPSIYRAYKENYKIVFIFKDSSEYLYKKSDGRGGEVEVSSIDLEKDVLGSNEEKEKFIRVLLYGGNSDYEADRKNFEKSGIFLQGKNFYDTIEEKTFVEKLGVYYQEEISGQSDAPDTNKTKKRVITYVEN